MTTINLPYFGQIDLIELKEYYKVKIELNKNEFSIKLSFKNNSISAEEAEKIGIFLSNIKHFELQNRRYIDEDFEGEGDTKSYLNFYMQEFDDDELSRIVDFNDKDNLIENQFLHKLKLISVWIYPDGKYGADYYGIFDYTIEIDGEACNQLLVVNINRSGNLNHISWES